MAANKHRGTRIALKVSSLKSSGLARAVASESQIDQPVKEFGKWHSRRFPHFRIHGDGSEAGDGIDLVDVELARGGLQQEIDTRHSFAFDGLVSGYRQPLHLLSLLRWERRGQNRFSRVQDVF